MAKASTACVHRWMLGEPLYGVVQGICRACGAKRRYPSHLAFMQPVDQEEELDAERPPLATVQATLEEHAHV